MGKKRIDDAVAKYREFHRYDPKKVGEFPASFEIPTRMFRAGIAKWVTYQSSKVDPETLRRPKRPVNYIHEHDAGVETFLAEPHDDADREIEVPARFRQVDALVRLGACLGFYFEPKHGDGVEAAGSPPLPDLYSTPDGKCLLVVQSRKRVIAMMWGGALGVYARGIDG